MLFNLYYDNESLEKKKAQLKEEGYSLKVLRGKDSFIPRQILSVFKNTPYHQYSWDFLRYATKMFTQPLPYWLGAYALDPFEDCIKIIPDDKSLKYPVVPKNALLILPVTYQKALTEYMLYSKVNMLPFQDKELHLYDNIQCEYIDGSSDVCSDTISVVAFNVTDNPEDYYIIMDDYYEEGYCDGAPDGGWVQHTNRSLECLHFVKVGDNYLPVIYFKNLPEDSNSDSLVGKTITPIRDAEGFVIDIKVSNKN